MKLLKLSLKFLLFFAIGLVIAIFFDYLNGGIETTLN